MTDTWGGCPIHPIIHHPHKYQIIELHLSSPLDDEMSSYLDLTLQKGEIVRRLRFLRPRQIMIEEGFPTPTNGMIILDLRSRQMEDLRVEVADFEASNGSITFVAADVLDLDS